MHVCTGEEYLSFDYPNCWWQLLAQVLRGFSGWNHLKRRGLRGKDGTLAWHSFSVSNDWFLPDYSHGQSRYWRAESFHEPRPNPTCCLDCSVNSYGWVGRWKVRSSFESKSCKISSWGYGYPVWNDDYFYLRTDLTGYLFLVCENLNFGCTKSWRSAGNTQKKMRPFIDELFRLTKSVCLLTRCSHHLEHRSVF